MSLSKPNDFAEDVLEKLRANKITFHGCRPSYLQYLPGGDLKLWFYGDREGIGPWGGGITIMKREGMDNALIRGDSEAFTEVIMACIEEINSRHA